MIHIVKYSIIDLKQDKYMYDGGALQFRTDRHIGGFKSFIMFYTSYCILILLKSDKWFLHYELSKENINIFIN